MRKITLIYFLIFICLWGCNQHEEKDHEFPPNVEAIKEVEKFTIKGKALIDTNLDSALYFIRKGFHLASKVHDHQGLFDNMILLASSHIKVGEYDGALEIYREMEYLLAELPNKAKFTLKAKRGQAYAGLQDYEKAIIYYQRVLDSLNQIEHQSLYASTLIHLGKAYRAQELDSLAFVAQNQASKILAKGKFKELRLEWLTEMGLLFEQPGTLDSSIHYFKKVLFEEDGLLSSSKKASVLNLLSRIYQKSMNPKSSIENARKSLILAKQKDDLKNAAIACDNLAKCYQLLKETEVASKYRLLSSDYNKQFLTVKMEKISMILRTSFDLGKTELENHLLREKEEILEKGMKQGKLTIFLICIALLLAIFLATLFSVFNRNKNKTNELLKEQNAEIKAQKRDIELAMQRLKTTQNQLVQSEKLASIGLLTAGIAHEINNPVNFVYAGVNGLEKNLNALMNIVALYDGIQNKNAFDLVHPQIKKLKAQIDYEEVLTDINHLMTSIKDGAVRTGEIVAGLKTFSRTDSGNKQLIDVHQNLDATLVLLNSQLKDKIVVEKQYTTNLSPIESYKGQVNQVFLNILTNAIQAILPKSGKIQIITKELAETIEIEIKDTGAGISTENLKKIFDPFYTTKEVGVGTGLGLSISYGIIQKHNGTIKVKSEQNKGTSFIIALPKSQEQKM